MELRSETARQEAIVDRVHRLLRKDGRVLSAWLVGSLAQGAGDRFSDVDLYIVPRDEYYQDVYSEREDLAQSLGDVLSTFEVIWPNCEMLLVIFRNGIELDLCYCRLDQCEIFKSDCSYKVLFDKSGELEARLRDPVLHDGDPVEEVHKIVGPSHYHFLHAIHGVARADLWSALYHVERLRALYIRLVASRLDRELPEWKALGQCDGVEHRELKRTFCAFDRESVRAAIGLLAKLFESELALLTQKYETAFEPEQMAHWKDYIERVFWCTAEPAANNLFRIQKGGFPWRFNTSLLKSRTAWRA
jgi:predicted nucleotidyltransferase